MLTSQPAPGPVSHPSTLLGGLGTSTMKMTWIYFTVLPTCKGGRNWQCTSRSTETMTPMKFRTQTVTASTASVTMTMATNLLPALGDRVWEDSAGLIFPALILKLTLRSPAKRPSHVSLWVLTLHPYPQPKKRMITMIKLHLPLWTTLSILMKNHHHQQTILVTASQTLMCLRLGMIQSLKTALPSGERTSHSFKRSSMTA